MATCPTLVRLKAGALVFLGTLAETTIPVRGADLAALGAKAPISSDTSFQAEVFAGYLTGQSREYVYNVPGDRSKLSQLNWRINGALVLGGRLSYQPLDWLTLRGSGWASVSSRNSMDDFDWLFGYNGFNSWSDWSHHEQTKMPTAVQTDVGVAGEFWRRSGASLSALGGYRFQEMKWNAYGGDFVYSSTGFRNEVGSFPDNELGISYKQWWHTPYLGIGTRYSFSSFALSAELIGSPFVFVGARDNHVGSTLFIDDFSPTSMVGVSVGAEYAMTERVSFRAKVEYQKFFQAYGGTEVIDYANSEYLRLPKPAGGADHESLLLSLGVMGKL